MSINNNKYFNVGSSFSYWIIQKTDNNKKSIVDGVIVDLSNIFYLPRNATKSLSIHQNIINHGKQNGVLPVVSDTSCHSSKKFVVSAANTSHIYPHHHTNAIVKYSSIKSKYFNNKKIVWTMSGKWQPFYDDGVIGQTECTGAILVSNQNEGINLLSYLNSKLIKFIVETGKWSGWLHGDVIKSLPKIDLIRSWTDEEIYAHFNLTQEEIDYIEATIK
ncbi:MAG: hypothetical protein HC836_23405 [Richelia sp. RM2_1_2]|nr:hypothetical protein [Richelia sp. RM2_1_2]